MITEKYISFLAIVLDILKSLPNIKNVKMIIDI